MTTKILSRRNLLAGAGATAVAVGLGESAHAADTVYDVIVIGAGPAGVSAGRTIQSYGKSFLILEAMDRVGGRTFTDNTTFPVPIDTGAQFLGDVVSGNNVLYQIARSFGLQTISSNDVPFGFLNGNEANFLTSYALALSALLAQGELIRDGVIRDQSIGRSLAGYRSLPYFDAVTKLLLLQDGADLKTGSMLDYYNFAAHSPAPLVYPFGDTLFLPSGMGNLIKRLSSGLPCVLNSPVTSIAYDANPVTITVKGGKTYKARKVVVTASTGVLAAKTIAFSPDLPASHAKAIKNLPLGGAYKAVFSFKKNVFAGHQGVVGSRMKSLADLVVHPSLSVFVNNFGAPVAVFVADGDLGDSLEQKTKAQTAAFFLNILEKYFPGAKAQWTGKMLATTWRDNPYTLGATSFATVGNVSARTALAAPLKHRVWFAGEALSISDHSQAHGAWLSGQSAAYGALSSLGAAVRSAA